MMKCTMLYLAHVTWGLILFIMEGTHGFNLIYIGDHLITCGFIAYMQLYILTHVYMCLQLYGVHDMNIIIWDLMV